MIVPLLLLLVACVGTDSSDETHYPLYGGAHRLWLPFRARSLKFIPDAYGSPEKILWKRDDEASARNNNFVVTSLTHRDTGRYVLLDKNQRVLSTVTLKVTAIMMTLDLTTGEFLNVSSAALKRDSCDIYFYPDHDYTVTQDEAQFVFRGRLHRELTCEGLVFEEPCGVLKRSVEISCKGRYEIRDESNNLAKEVFVNVEDPPYDPWHIGVGVGAALFSSFCCCCMRRCCCKKKSSKKDAAENDSNAPTSAAGPAVGFREYVHPPVVIGRDRQPAETYPHNQPSHAPTGPLIHNPPTVNVPPSYAPTGPLIHNPPTVNLPPSYAEDSSPAERSSGPTAPVSDPAIQFELKGVSFPSAPPLTSDSTLCYVYNSDKLNYI